MNKVLIWLLTRTAAARAIGLFIASLFVGWGVIQEEQTEAITGLLIVLITGLASLGIEKRKTDETKLTQMQEGAKPDGLAGPKTRAKIRENRHGGRPV